MATIQTVLEFVLCFSDELCTMDVNLWNTEGSEKTDDAFSTSLNADFNNSSVLISLSSSHSVKFFEREKKNTPLTDSFVIPPEFCFLSVISTAPPWSETSNGYSNGCIPLMILYLWLIDAMVTVDITGPLLGLLYIVFAISSASSGHSVASGSSSAVSPTSDSLTSAASSGQATTALSSNGPLHSPRLVARWSCQMHGLCE